MKQILHEQLSALVDDELAPAEQALLLKRLAQDATLREQLARYQLISDSLQNHLPECVDAGFHRRISAALQDEPALTSGTRRISGLFRPLAGAAVAASVAVVAVLALQSVREQEPAGVPAVAGAAAGDDYIRAAQAPQPQPATGSTQTLDVYLVNHNEYAVNRGMQGMLPYMRLVGSESNIESKD